MIACSFFFFCTTHSQPPFICNVYIIIPVSYLSISLTHIPPMANDHISIAAALFEKPVVGMLDNVLQ